MFFHLTAFPRFANKKQLDAIPLVTLIARHTAMLKPWCPLSKLLDESPCSIPFTDSFSYCYFSHEHGGSFPREKKIVCRRRNNYRRSNLILVLSCYFLSSAQSSPVGQSWPSYMEANRNAQQSLHVLRRHRTRTCTRTPSCNNLFSSLEYTYGGFTGWVSPARFHWFFHRILGRVVGLGAEQ